MRRMTSVKVDVDCGAWAENKCEHVFEVEEYEDIGKVFVCPACGTRQELNYDDGYDPDTGEESPAWWMTPVKQRTK